jgi:ribosomal protein S18 acetylase RimI-like enzyme
MTNELKIRLASNTDAKTLTEMARKSFYDTFHDHPKNAPEDLQIYMDEAFTPEAFAAELADKDSIFFVAEIKSEIVGYVKLKRFVREEGISGENPIELCRLYALQNFIGKGIGKSLMLQSLDFAKESGHDIIWLGVWEFNHRAQEFYTKFGFEKCGEHIFQLGNDPQTDWLMERNLNTYGHRTHIKHIEKIFYLYVNLCFLCFYVFQKK